MKTPLHLLSSLCLLTVTFAVAGDQPADDGITAVTQSPAAPALTYDTAEFIHAMPRLRGVVLEKFPCCVLMGADDGSNFWIGSPAGTSEVTDFIATLKKGGSYTFPDAFVAWERKDKQPAVVTAAQHPARPAISRLLARVENVGRRN